MCGAISIKYQSTFDSELSKYFSHHEIEKFKQTGNIIFAYWDKNPKLPIRAGNSIRLIDWGNRDKSLSLPKTGWARLESLLKNKWDMYKPKVVLVPASKGCDKKIWFDLDADIKAVLVEKNGEARVFMITEQATPEFEKRTGHNRMPRLNKLA